MHNADVSHPTRTLEEKLRYLFQLNRDKTVALGFRAPYLRLLEKFGNPHLKLPPVIHVSGTNGKGSVIAALRAIFEERGLHVHVYTSPHLIRFNERIVIAGKEIEDVPLEALIDEAITLNQGEEVTFFEITTALAFAAFARTPADICLLEVGMGGRLDCTNVIENPLVTIAATISGDHKEFLGESLAEIAAEKAGIFKSGCPAVNGYQTTEGLESGVEQVFEDRARELGIPLYRAGKEWSCVPEGTDHMRFRFDEHDLVLPRPNLAGEHQIRNAGAVLAALHVIKSWTDEEAIRNALHSIRWPGRLQRIGSGALGDIIPPGWEIYLDGGHNDSAGDVLAHQAECWAADDGKPLHIVTGMLKKKEPRPFLRPLVPHAMSLSAMVIPSASEDSMTPDELAEKSSLPICALEGSTIKENLAHFFARTQGPGRLLICGSIYLAGDVLAAESPEKIEKNDFLP